MPTTTTTPLTFGASTGDPPAPVIRGPVLLASDGRARTDATAIAARAIAARLSAPVEVLSVLEPLPVYDAGFDAPILPPDFERERRAELHARVCNRLEPVLGARDGWHVDLRYGAIGRTIAGTARERHAGLIVVGTGGHGAIDRLLGEEVSVQVVRQASTPVLAVAPDADGPMRRAVVGMDFGAASLHAARTALALLEPRDGSDAVRSLTLVHVKPLLENTPGLQAAWAREYDVSVTTMLARVQELLRPYVPAGVLLETREFSGRVQVLDALRATAAETGADLVAVGTHGPGWMERLFVGSVATAVLRHVRTSVLVAPTPAAAERVRLELRVAGQVTLERVTDWPGALDAFTRRNLCRRARLEVTDAEQRGFVVEAERYRFHGASFDPHGARGGQLSLMLGEDAADAGHLTHAVTDVRAIEIVAADDRRDRTLLVDGAAGQVVLTFLD